MDNGSYLKMGFIGGVQWVRASAPRPRGIVFVPPLIGGHGLQQIRMLRQLVHHGFNLISFSYAGHGESSGAFSFQAAIDNCLAVLDSARQQSRKKRLPLYGIASCFGALPMIHAAAQRGEPLARVALINAVPHWRWEKLVIDFSLRWARSGHGWLSLKGIRTAMYRYLEDLFPRVVHRSRSFGILPRRRMQWLKMAGELLILRRRSPSLLSKTPVLCAYGRRDRLLQQIGFGTWSGYETHIRDICPQTRFWRLDGDHFLCSPNLRYRLLNTVAIFFSTPSPKNPLACRLWKDGAG